MAGKILLKGIDGDGNEIYIPWISSSSFPGVAKVYIQQHIAEVAELEHTGDTNAVEFGVCSTTGYHFDVHDVVINVLNGAPTKQGAVLEYWNGTAWAILFKFKVLANTTDQIVWAVRSHFDTGARDATEKFFRLTNTHNDVETCITILGVQEE